MCSEMLSANEILSSQLEPTSEKLRQEICQTFETSVKQIKQDVEVLKEWIRQQPHLPQSSSDVLLINFLVSSKNRMERAKEKIDNYYSARLRMPDFFGSRDPEGDRACMTAEEMRMFVLPKFTQEGCRVTMITFSSGDPDRFDISAVNQWLMSIGDVRFNFECFYFGDYCLVDAALFSTTHMLRITPTWARDFIHCIQDALPLRVKGIIVFNAPPYMKLIMNVLKPFIKGKLIDRFHFHTEGPEIVEKYFPRKMLPRDYGGEEDTSEKLHEAWCHIVRENRAWLMSEGAVTVDEKKRIGGPSRKGNNFHDLQGSFKTFCVD